jgi:hypothetical protein
MNGTHPGGAASVTESPVEQFIDDELLHPHHHTLHSLRWGTQGTGEVGPLPLIVGVTGHRDLCKDDLPRLTELVIAELSYLRKTYPATPLTLLSALADGADRLVARIALEAGMRLAVVLPMPAELYETDFDAASLEEFHRLIERAEYYTELPIMPGLTREDIQEHGLFREQQYALVGAYLASRSAILIALWDGVELNLIGGTSQVVQFKLEGVPEPFAKAHSELDAPDTGPVYHIVTPRSSNPHPARAFTTRRIYPTGFPARADAEKAYHDVYERMEAFNTDAIKYSEELKEHFRTSKEYVLPARVHHLVGHHRKRHHPKGEQHSKGEHKAELPLTLREDLDFYAIADVLSQRFQRRTKTTLQLLLTFVFFAALFYEMYSGLFQEPVMLGLYLGMFLLSFVVYYWAEQHGFQTRYLDYRALAEGLRVQFFWKLAGVQDSVADFYMRKQRSELDWIRNAIRAGTIESTPHASDMSAPEDRDTEREHLKLVLKHWVEDQAKYFAKSAHRDHRILHVQEKRIMALFIGALLLAAVQAFLYRHPNEYILLGIGVFPVLAAVLHSYLQKNALAEHKRQYDRMSVFYHRATVHLEKLLGEDRLADARAFVAELGREALVENGDWILMHRDRPLEVPKGA